MYKSILVPVDMSADGFSDKAIEHAVNLLADGGTIHFLRVVPGYQMPLVGSFFPEDAFAKALEEADAHLAKFIAAYFKQLTVDYKTYTLEGKPADIILRTADKLRVELIVLASHKHSRVEKTVLGSIASKVVGRAKVPVMVVKNNI